MTVLLADGRIVRTGSRARKSATGYDLTRLLVGSEGTLRAITELTLRLYPLPEALSSAVCAFGSLDDPVATVIRTKRAYLAAEQGEALDGMRLIKRALDPHDLLNPGKLLPGD